MTITVKIGETPIASDIIFTSMSPWIPQPKIKQREPDGADYSVVMHVGKKSPIATLKGYFKRTQANITEYNKLLNGDIITIIHSVEGTHNGIVTSHSVSESAGGGLWLTFSMTVVDQ